MPVSFLREQFTIWFDMSMNLFCEASIDAK